MHINKKIAVIMLSICGITFTGSPDPGPFNRDGLGLSLSEHEREARVRRLEIETDILQQQIPTQEELAFERNATAWQRFSHPRNLERIFNSVAASALNGILIISSKALFEYFTKNNSHEKQLIEQEIEINKVKVEQAKLALQAAKNETQAKNAMRMLAIQDAAIRLKERENEALKNKKLIEIGSKIELLVEKKSTGQELTESEQESYSTYQKMLEFLSRMNAKTITREEAPGAA